LEDIDSAGIRRDKSSVIPEQEHDSAVNEADKSSAPAPTEKVTEEKEDNNDNKDESRSEEKQHDGVDIEKKKSIRRRITHSLRPRKSSSKTNSETTTLATTASSPASAPPSVLTPAPSIKEVATSTKPTSTPTPPPPPPPPPPIDEEGSKSKISLAGLLNIIDGAASSEGRVLIMTTNYPEKLDSALIRPGRVDLQIKFTLATRTQVEEIFRRMYSDEADSKKCDGSSDGGEKKYAPEKNGNDNKKKKAATAGNKSPNFATLPPDQLTDMARQFADALPEAVFSPAEIQGYLLQKKSDPQGALDGVGEWRDAVLEAKKKGKKVIELK
jgi:chaperone BCS1